MKNDRPGRSGPSGRSTPHLRLIGGTGGEPAAPAQGAETGLRDPSAAPHRPASGFRATTPRPSGDPWDELQAMPVAPDAVFRTGHDRPGVDLAYDRLRERVIAAARANGWSRIALAAPTRGCGASMAALNLADRLTRVPGLRALMLDLNLSRPGLARLLGLPVLAGTGAFLRGEIAARDYLVRLTEGLAVGLAGGVERDSAALLQSELAASVAGHLMDRYTPDLMLFDLPPLLERDDLAAFLPQVDAVLLVADALSTRPEHVAACEARLEGRAPILGVVLNRVDATGSPDAAC